MNDPRVVNFKAVEKLTMNKYRVGDLVMDQKAVLGALLDLKWRPI